MFKIKDMVVYPGYGVAVISKIINKKLGGKEVSFFKLDFIYKDVNILLPVYNAESCGVRYPSDKSNIKKLFDLLYEKDNQKIEFLDFTPSGWNRRNKDYQLKIQSGNLFDLVKVYKSLMAIAQQKDLSFGEKKMLMLAEDLLYQEIRLVTEQEHSVVLDQLHAPFRQFIFQQSNVKQFSSVT